MGYRSDFYLTTDAPITHDILHEITGYYWDEPNILYDAKWYEHQEHLHTLSTRFPDHKFELLCKGEDGDQWRVKALNGETTTHHSSVVFVEPVHVPANETLTIEGPAWVYVE